MLENSIPGLQDPLFLKYGVGFDGEETTLSISQEEVCFCWSSIIIFKHVILGSSTGGGCNHIEEGWAEEEAHQDSRICLLEEDIIVVY